MDQDKPKGRTHTSIAISLPEKQRLDRFCKKYSLKNGEFVTLALDYFIGNGINPKDDDRNLPKDEIKKILKAVNDTRGATFDFNKKQVLPWLENNIKQLFLVEEAMEKVTGMEAQNIEFIRKLEKAFSNLGVPL